MFEATKVSVSEGEARKDMQQALEDVSRNEILFKACTPITTCCPETGWVGGS